MTAETPRKGRRSAAKPIEADAAPVATAITETPRKGRRSAAKSIEVEAAPVDTETDEVKGVTAAKGRATPGRRQVTPETEERRGIFGRVIDYVQGVRAELDKVAWPTRDQVVSLFRVVLFVTIAAAAVLGIIAFLFNELFAYGLTNPLIFVIFGAGVAAVVIYVMRRNAEGGPSR